MAVSDAARTPFAVAPASTGQANSASTGLASVQPNEAPARGAERGTGTPIPAAESPAAAAMAEAAVKYTEEIPVAATIAAEPPDSAATQATLPAPDADAASDSASAAPASGTAADASTATDAPPASDAPAPAREAEGGNRSRKHRRTARPRAQRRRARPRAPRGEEVSPELTDGNSDPKEIEVEEDEPLSPPGRSRTNPKRRCRCRAAPLATTIEWTRMQVAHCKNLAEKIVWNTSDSLSLRESLEVRQEPTPGVGLGLYLKHSIVSCCCTEARMVRETEERLVPELILLHQQEKRQDLYRQMQHQQRHGEQQHDISSRGLVDDGQINQGLCAVSEPAAAGAGAGRPHGAQQSSSPIHPSDAEASASGWEAHSLWGRHHPHQQQQQPLDIGARQSEGTGGPEGTTIAVSDAILHVASGKLGASIATATETNRASVAGKKAARFCSCNPNSCFRVLCFRGDPVLSPFNFMATAGKSALSAEEKKVLMAPEENPGFEPYQHLSPAFTLSRHDMPFSLQLQADPYLSSEMMRDVKAIYANHYCAVHCKGFFEQSESEVPCIVTRPGRISEGYFGVFYGYKSETSFPCAFPGCGHVCLPRCRCYELERAWRCLWTRHHRKAADIVASS